MRKLQDDIDRMKRFLAITGDKQSENPSTAAIPLKPPKTNVQNALKSRALLNKQLNSSTKGKQSVPLATPFQPLSAKTDQKQNVSITEQILLKQNNQLENVKSQLH